MDGKSDSLTNTNSNVSSGDTLKKSPLLGDKTVSNKQANLPPSNDSSLPKSVLGQSTNENDAVISDSQQRTGEEENNKATNSANSGGESIVPQKRDSVVAPSSQSLQKGKSALPAAGISEEDFKGKTIAEILRDKGKIEPDQFEEVKFEVANKKEDEEKILRNKGWVDEEEIYKAKAASYGIPFVDFEEIDIPRDILTKLPYETAKAHRAIFFKEDPNLAHVGMVDPLDIQGVNFIQSVLRKNVKAYFASPGGVKTVLDTKYAGRMESEVTEAVEEVGEGVVEIEEGIQDISEVENTIANAPVARIVNMILEYAVRFKASDVHIEPREHRLAVRFRINGIMMERLQLPVKLIAPVVSRVKILSDLKIDEHRVPQDGRFQIKVGDKEVDLRVSIMPIVGGEKVVIRLLEKGKGLMKLEDTGMRGSGYKVYREALEATQGIILITGPTGSGKTQTLASSLIILNKPSVNIVTLENPVEIKVDGVNQIQINADVGLTFAKGLRSVLRQDPDIIMVGEIRDTETAQLAVQASLTGHLVLATLHTNSAAGALPRLLDMEIEPYLLTSTVNVIVGQRLVRTICEKCKESYKASDELVKTIHKGMVGLQGFDMYSYPKNTNNLVSAGNVSTLDTSKVPPRELEKQQQARSDKDIVLYRGTGCSKCNNTGYSGRIGIFEVMKVSERSSQLIMEHRSAGELERQAISEGMITMLQDGFMKALEGVTTIEEVLRVQKK